MQRIEVKNFGPLKDLTLDIKDYMIFIGPQASGKSTLAKLIYFSNVIEIQRYLLLVRFGATRLTQNDVSVNLFTQGFPKMIRESFGVYFKDLFLSQYEFTIFFKEYSITFRKNSFEISKGFNDEFHYINNNFSKIISAQYSELRKMIGNKSVQLYSENITTQYTYDSPRARLDYQNIFIPAQRYLISLFSERDFPDQFLYDYKGFIERTNPYSLSGITDDSRFYKFKKNVLELSAKIIKGEYAYINHRKVLFYDIDRYVELSEASSGQQEALWIIEAIKDIFVALNHNDIDSYDLIIEEPETHLFPEAQRDMTYLISLLANQPGSRVVITTHSPYVLAALNNLLKAYSVGHEDGKKEQVESILPSLFWVDPARFYVGYMEKGTITSIFDKNTNLIVHEMLDKVSDDIISQFDQLLEIQYNE